VQFGDVGVLAGNRCRVITQDGLYQTERTAGSSATIRRPLRA
jgi:hypothetical protein